MSEEKQSGAGTSQRPENQRERWIKYGTNVVLVSVVVVALAIALIWLGQSKGVQRRIDTTQSGLYSLKPQTINIIKNNQQDVRIVSLYTRAKDKRSYEEEVAEDEQFDAVTPVSDLLEEYERKGNRIKVEIIDPREQPTRVDQLVGDVTDRYAGEVQKYRQVVEDYKPALEEIQKLADAEVKKVATLPFEEIKDRELAETVGLTITTIQNLPRDLAAIKKETERWLAEKIPDWKGTTDAISQGMGRLTTRAERLLASFEKQKEDANVPEAFRNYMRESLPVYQRIKELASGIDGKIKALPELKLDELKQSLKQNDTILVMGDKEMRVIARDRIWQKPEDARDFDQEGKPQLRFAGEQQVTGAILAVTNAIKPKVVFVRPGGPPLTTLGNIFQATGPLAFIAQRLRDYNFEVMEKDLSGMWEMQSRMQRSPMPPAPEPTEEQIKDAVWVVVGLPSSQQSPFGGPPPQMGPKVAQHLKNGGSALILSDIRGENFAEALADFGVTIRPDVAAVHEAVPGPRSADPIEQAQRNPVIFIIQNYGDHLITKPINSLDGIILPMLVVETAQKAGIKSTKILPVPESLKVWGETNLEEYMRTREVKYDAPSGASIAGDLPPPLWSGAVVEREDGKGRVVVIGSVTFAMNDVLGWPDERYPGFALRFPGNSELFCNSIFWLNRMETMIDISPSAMTTARVKDMSRGAANFWRIGFVLIALPLAVILSGAAVYAARRD